MSGPILLVLRLVMTGFLYAFLVWALWILWRDLRKQGQLSTAREAPEIRLVSDESASEPWLFITSEIFIGRDPTCDVCLEDTAISARHARLSFHHNQWWVEDLHSRNGTYLNSELVTEPMVITTGDELRCGQILFRITLQENK